MNLHDCIHGFKVRYVQPLPEIKATLYRMEYEKNGADLVWLDREDDNKTFAIAFKTIPRDDTGVFHILEHSVLCGSQKYPVKEPFVELLKSSLQTFLNAFTFPDKTMYPVSSRNDQDFLNLIDVYMDAVLHPLSIADPSAFLQEGWHYELDSPDGALRCNGVVYNEMKGAYADPDTVLQGEMNRLLFPDTCYGFESGGHPDHITELTYEAYLASHARFYHPSNSRIFLDGSVDLDAVLAKLDHFLSGYDRLKVDADIPMQPPVHPEERVCRYEIGPEEDGENKVILAGGWVFGTYDEQEKNLACSVLSEVLCSSNESPLKKALLEQGLAEDVEFQTLDGIQQQYVLLVIRNTTEAKKDRAWQVVRETLQTLVEQGLDQKRLNAVLNHLEFITREKDFGGMPRGLVYAMSSLDSWLYGGDPAQNLCRAAVFQSLRAKAGEGYFERFLRECLLDNPHQARLCMLPSLTLGQENQEKEQARLQALRSGWDASTAASVMGRFQQLRAHQEAPDSPEQLASLPVLSLSDIPETVREIPQVIESVEGTPLLHQTVDTDGIVYLDLYFSLADIPQEKLSQVSFLSKLLGQTATEHYGVIELRSEIESNLGRFSAAPMVFAPHGQNSQASPYLAVSVSLLEEKKADAVRLIGEVLNASLFHDQQYIYHLLRQSRMNLEQSIVLAGNSFAAHRALAGFSAAGAVSEAFQGIDFLRWMQKTDRSFEAEAGALCGELARLSQMLFIRERLTVSVTGPCDTGWVSQVIRTLPSAPVGEAAEYRAAPVRREGFLIPAEVGFAAKAGSLDTVSARYTGQARVAAQLLTYGYLWNTIRVKGGAYGTSLNVQADGGVSLSSYRDPSAAQSLHSFDGAGAALRDVCNSGETLDKYIISTIAAAEPLLTPRQEGLYAAIYYFTGRTKEDRQRLRREILRTTRADLAAFSRTLDALCSRSGVCVIGGKRILDECGETLDSVESLQ